mgnify:CR=1 FL=1
MGDKFEIKLKNGEKKEATLITRINTENTKNEYIYYFIKNTDNNNVSIYASKIVKEDSKEIMKDLSQKNGYNINANYNDCGVLIFDKATQDTHAGGSGCACCGTVFSGYLFNMLQTKKYKKILLIATGALMNSTSTQQGESIPGIAHAVSIEV